MSTNPLPFPKEIDYQKVAELIVKHGWDQAVLYARREGANGGETVVSCGLTYRDAEIAREMADFLKSKVFGWQSEESAELDKIVAEAKKEMAEGPLDGDPDTGKKLLALP